MRSCNFCKKPFDTTLIFFLERCFKKFTFQWKKNVASFRKLCYNKCK